MRGEGFSRRQKRIKVSAEAIVTDERGEEKGRQDCRKRKSQIALQKKTFTQKEAEVSEGKNEVVTLEEN